MFGILHDYVFCLGGHVYGDNTVLAVSVEYSLAVGTPTEAADVGVVACGQLDGFASFSGLQVDFSFTRAVGDVGYVSSVRTPVGFAFVGAGGTGNVARYTFCGGHVEYFATCGYGQAFTVGRKSGCGHIVGYMLLFGAGIDVFSVERDADLLVLACLRIETVEVTGMFIHNLLAVGAGEFDVVVGIVGYFLRLSGSGVVDEKVHCPVAVGDKIDVIADPHGADVLCHVVC